jgi:hypothetical protein
MIRLIKGCEVNKIERIKKFGFADLKIRTG